MQLDQTRVKIRERNLLEICDLAMRVLLDFSPKLLIVLLIGIVPFAVLNWLLLSWMTTEWDAGGTPRYLWCMVMLVFIEAPLATAPATVFLGDAMFLSPPSLRQTLRTCLKFSWQLFVCQAFLRGVIAAVLLVLTLRLTPYDPSLGDALLPLLVMYLMLIRSLRPFVNEIILLEQSPLRAKDKRTITIGRRSSKLHTPNSGELMARFLGSAILAAMLSLSLTFSFWFFFGTVMQDWRWGDAMTHVCTPAALWMVAGFFAVVRYLGYLDLRIRREGWAVELQLRAEANRLVRQTI